MASSTKTPNYNLNQYAGTDVQKRVDVNADNLAIDTALKGLEDNKATKTEVSQKVGVSAISNDVNFTGNSDELIPTQKATEARIRNLIAALVDSSPATLDTLKELATALGNDPNFATTMATQLGLKLNSSEAVATQTANKVVKRDSNKQIAGTINLDNDKLILLNLQDLNTLTKTGFYRLTNYINYPAGISGAIYAKIYQADTNYYLQEITSETGLTYSRSCVNSAWSAWKLTIKEGYFSSRKLIADSTIVRSTWTYFDIELLPQKIKIVLYGAYVGAAVGTEIAISENLSNTTFEVEIYDDGGTLRIRPFVNVNTGDEVFVKFTNTQLGINSGLNGPNRVLIISEKF